MGRRNTVLPSALRGPAACGCRTTPVTDASRVQSDAPHGVERGRHSSARAPALARPPSAGFARLRTTRLRSPCAAGAIGGSAA